MDYAKRKTFSASLPEPTLAKLKDIAKKRGFSVSHTVRMLVEHEHAKAVRSGEIAA